MAAYYNEFEPYAAEWLRNLIKAGLIPDGEVDTRSIVDVRGDDLRGFAQCHFFAGLGGWAYAARLAGWADDRPLWTGSCPCQPFSVAGKGEGQADARHLWPEWFRLIRECRPDAIFGEQVAAAIGKDWLDGVCSDLEGEGYACGPIVLPACALDAPHRRDRLWFVAMADAQSAARWEGSIYRPGGMGAADGERASVEPQRRGEDGGTLVHAIGAGLGGQPRHGDDGREPGRLDAQQAGSIAETGRRSDVADAIGGERDGRSIEPERGPQGRIALGRPGEGVGFRSPWQDAGWIIGADGKARRIPQPGVRGVVDGLPASLAGSGTGRDAEEIPLLATGIPARVGKLRALGNAIVPQVAAKIIKTIMQPPTED